MTWEYLAGFFDGEGCVFYTTRPYGRYVIVHVSQGEVNESRSHIQQQIHAFLVAQGIRARLTVEARSKWSNQTRVIASSGGACRQWLEGMLPYLVVKREAALAALEFIQSLPGRTGRPKGVKAA